DGQPPAPWGAGGPLHLDPKGPTVNASTASTPVSPISVDPDVYSIAVRGLLVNEAGAVLLVRRRLRAAGDDRWCRLPGGRAADGEWMRDALVRHIREQTGLSFAVPAAKIRGVDSTTATPKVAAMTTYYYSFSDAVPAAFAIVLPEDFDHFAWATPTDLDRLCAPDEVPQVKAVLAAARDDDCIEMLNGRIAT
ncbi:NUDIX hydrolase, partial [Streptomyces sp. NPDC057654]|uniref:NUDIX hydrolase n=1 Tax=Streptomyces sp. NPDC057654 TaxID=3346196 RepID=UPI0036857C5A